MVKYDGMRVKLWVSFHYKIYKCFMEKLGDCVSSTNGFFCVLHINTSQTEHTVIPGLPSVKINDLQLAPSCALFSYRTSWVCLYIWGWVLQEELQLTSKISHNLVPGDCPWGEKLGFDCFHAEEGMRADSLLGVLTVRVLNSMATVSQ